jgi:hypothetical protein
MKIKYFVILLGCNGEPVPLVDENRNIAVFDSEQEANQRADENMLGQAHGYEVFQWDYCS